MTGKQNYEDSNCIYGYMTICDECKEKAPRHVDTSIIVQGFPLGFCEICDNKEDGVDYAKKKKR